jgi:hypothetical protein
MAWAGNDLETRRAWLASRSGRTGGCGWFELNKPGCKAVAMGILRGVWAAPALADLALAWLAGLGLLLAQTKFDLRQECRVKKRAVGVPDTLFVNVKNTFLLPEFRFTHNRSRFSCPQSQVFDCKALDMKFTKRERLSPTFKNANDYPLHFRAVFMRKHLLRSNLNHFEAI